MANTSILEFGEEDYGNVLHLEHLNLDISDQQLASVFYCEGLGLTRDPYDKPSIPTMWINAGFQQFHLGQKGKGSQVVQGMCVGLIYPDINMLEIGLKAVENKLKGTKFSWQKCSVDISSASNKYDVFSSIWNQNSNSAGNFQFLEVTCPWGNKFRIHEGHQGKPHIIRSNAPVDQTHHEQIFPFLLIRGSLGLAYVEFPIPHKTSQHISNFYSKFFGAPTQVVGCACYVSVGPFQNLIFKEAAEGFNVEDVGHHISFYVSNFESTFKKLKERNLIFVHEKFPDRVNSLEEAKRWKQFRFKNFVLDGTDEVFFSLEHEVRSVSHTSFMRPLVNRFGFNGMFGNQ
mmetsp:Transcript_5769/g.8061  ORF Transcript_5769/g.8061 Transcript_5769/m.8061 type:complete len:344 (+) Transcript_5769:46-1077(+)